MGKRNIRGKTNHPPAPDAKLKNMAFFGLCENAGESILLGLTRKELATMLEPATRDFLSFRIPRRT